MDFSRGPFRLGNWVVEPELNRMTCADDTTQIELKIMDVLVCLASHAGELVTRRQIIDAVWATEFITEKTLTRAVAELRRTLGDDARTPRFIETIHGRGYRLIAPVEGIERPPSRNVRFKSPGVRDERDRCPYPGLTSFKEDEAEFFFGREAEIRQLWRKITTRKLLAVIGPSGVGKSSLLRAGVIPASPEGWGTLILQPGGSVFKSLGRALVPVFREDEQAMAELLEIDSGVRSVAMVGRWRERHDRALLVVDQFEELFTLNPPYIQARFADVLGRLARDADVHVLLAMRDDFLVRCHALLPLRPILEDLTVLDRPNRASLRRALEQPAARLGYAFENDELLDELVDEVAEDRAALPIVAFTAARLWELRDRGRRMLTRRALVDIGGVGGSLGRHAEATIDRVGSENIPIVRELFRNLVTAEGTRAVRGWDEVLSIFSESLRESAGVVLRQLIDARLVTSYEEREADDTPTRRVEVVHESLLSSWPRLVGWRTQDADSARLRDELRRAARTWHEHGRPEDLLWSGSLFREFTVWRERYPGGLSESEQAFAEATTRYARKRRRRRGTLVTATIVVLFALLAVIGSLWQRSRAEALRAEAANLFALGQLELEGHPTAAVAYAAASLRLADNSEVRRLALEALWRGPTEIRLPTPSLYGLEFSPDGRWLATADLSSGARLWPADGGPPTKLEGIDSSLEIRFSPPGDLVAANVGTERREVGIWSMPDGRLVRRIPLGDAGSTFFFVFDRDGRRLITSTQHVGRESTDLVVRSWPVDGGGPEVVARVSIARSTDYILPDLDPTNSRFAWADGRVVRAAPLAGSRFDGSSTISMEHDRAVSDLLFAPGGLQLATMDVAGVVRLWSLEEARPRMVCAFHLGKRQGLPELVFDRTGSKLMAPGGLMLDLEAPPDAEPLRLGRPGGFGFGMTFGPNDDLLATSVEDSVSLWPLTHRYPRILTGHEGPVRNLVFTRDGRRLVSTSHDGTVRVWPLGTRGRDRCRTLDRFEGTFAGASSLAMAPDGSFVVVGTLPGQVRLLPLDGTPGRQFEPFTDNVGAVAVDHRSRLVAAGSGAFFREEATVHVWDGRSGEERVLDAGDGVSIEHLEFSPRGDLWVLSWPMLRRWSLQGDAPQVVEQIDLSAPPCAADGLCDFDAANRRALLWRGGDTIWLEDLDTHRTWEVGVEGPHGWCSLDPTGTIALTGDVPGMIRVSRIGSGRSHWLPGRVGDNAEVSPDGRWVASGGEDNTIWLWPMPDLESPPIHTLPRDELIAKLESLTNLRVVQDAESPTGWRLDVGPFPGWQKVPTW